MLVVRISGPSKRAWANDGLSGQTSALIFAGLLCVVPCPSPSLIVATPPALGAEQAHMSHCARMLRLSSSVALPTVRGSSSAAVALWKARVRRTASVALMCRVTPASVPRITTDNPGTTSASAEAMPAARAKESSTTTDLEAAREAHEAGNESKRCVRKRCEKMGRKTTGRLSVCTRASHFPCHRLPPPRSPLPISGHVDARAAKCNPPRRLEWVWKRPVTQHPLPSCREVVPPCNGHSPARTALSDSKDCPQQGRRAARPLIIAHRSIAALALGSGLLPTRK